MNEVKLGSNFTIKIYTKADEAEFLEMRKSSLVKKTPGMDTLRYLQITNEKSVLVVFEHDGEMEIPAGYATVLLLDDREYQKAVSRYFGIEINSKYFIADFIIAPNYRRSGIGKQFMKYIIEKHCAYESLMMHPNEEDVLFWHSVGFAFVGTDKKSGMRVN